MSQLTFFFSRWFSLPKGNIIREKKKNYWTPNVTLDLVRIWILIHNIAKNFDNNTELTYILYNNNGEMSINQLLIYPLLLRLILYKRDINIGIYFYQKYILVRIWTLIRNVVRNFDNNTKVTYVLLYNNTEKTSTNWLI